MKAVAYEGPAEVSVREVPDARVEHPADAVVRVSTAGVCGSDLHFFHGKAPLLPGETMGHEAVGVVETTGAEVAHFAPGDRVVVSFVIACGTCWFCEHGQNQLCEDLLIPGAGAFGGGLGGAQAELLRVPRADTNLLAVPDDVEDERAMFVGDVLTTGLYGAAAAGIEGGETVAVVGAGPVGFHAVQAARLRGAAQVVALDMEPDRLALAERVGAVPVNVRERNAQMALSEFADGRGADVAIECVGNPSGFDTALEVVRRGGVACVVGMYANEQIEAQLGVWWARALDIRFAGMCPVHSWWREAIAELRAGRLDPTPLISHRLPLEEAPEGYALFDSRRATKVLLQP